MLVVIPKEQALWVNTPHGKGIIFSMESFAHDNYIWTVILDDGRIRHYNTLQLTACRDHTSEINLQDTKPVFPAE